MSCKKQMNHGYVSVGMTRYAYCEYNKHKQQSCQVELVTDTVKPVNSDHMSVNRGGC